MNIARVLVALAVGLFALGASAQGGLILEYGFNETGTTAASSGSDATVLTLRNSGNTATDLHSAAGAGLTGDLGLAGSATDRAFDNSASSMGGSGGVANQVDLEAIDALMSFTVSVWYTQASAKGTTTFPRLISHRSGSNGFEIEAPTGDDTNDDGRIILDSDTNTNNRPPAGSYDSAVGTWVFFAFSYDGSITTNNAKFYRGFRSDAEAAAVDGTYVAAVTEVASFSINQGAVNNETAGLNVGNRSDRARAFDGLLDNFRYHGSKTDNTGALSTSQLETVRSADIVPEPSTLALVAMGLLAWRRQTRRQASR